MPAAVAWACAPQAIVETDKESYRPHEPMTVNGRYFTANAAIKVTSDPAGLSATTTSTSGGTFSAELEAPDEPGPYVLVATSSNGYRASTTFEVTLAPGRCANDKAGSTGADSLSGSEAGDRIFAFAGDDVVKALAADDCVDGGPGAEWLAGGLGDDTVAAQGGNHQAFGQDGDDRVSGKDGDDRLGGGPGLDTLAGGRGADVLTDHLGDGLLYGQGGPDRIYAGSGRFRIDAGSEGDYVSARNGRADTIDCGLGHDSARVDGVDRVVGCERVIPG